MTSVTTFRTEGLGDSTYLVVHERHALIVDPQRDIDRFLVALEASGAELRWVLETHLHNDYVSGGTEMARRTGAELVLPAAAAPAFRHTPAFHREMLTEGDLTVTPMHTPGHTPEHTSYVFSAGGGPETLFSGGSLLVGSAGRSDLLGDARADSLARMQFHSVRRLAELPDDTGLYPTHGAGSFCVASAAGGHMSTVGAERRHSPALAAKDEDSFVAGHLSDLQPYPAYYARMGPINLAGPRPMPPLDPPLVDAPSGSWDRVVDLRPAARFAAGHVPGSLNIPLSHQFGVWFGWLVDPEATVGLVAGPDDDLTEALTQLARIGIDEVAGVVVDPGPEHAGEQSSITTVEKVPHDGQVVDARSPAEWDGERPRTFRRYVPDLLTGPPPGLTPDEPAWVVCSSGYRSSIAASLLRRHGVEAVAVLDGGMDDLDR